MTETCLPLVTWLKNWFTSTDDLLDTIYPIGSIYMSVNNTSPQTLFGGTWVQLTDTFLYATSTTADDNVTTAPSGQGEATHTLTTDEMPKHNHTQEQHRHQLLSQLFSTGTGSESAVTNSTNRTATSRYTNYQTPTINDTGGGQAHNNMPPYMKVYMWKRTA